MIANCALLFGFAVIARIYYLLALKYNKPKSRDKHATSKTLIVLGSGGHTTEMTNLLSHIDRKRYSPRHYLVASSDQLSEQRVLDNEKDGLKSDQVFVEQIHRSRKVHQSYISSVFTTGYALLQCFWKVSRIAPDLILCNGPGTCVPVCLAAFVSRIFFVNTNCKIVFIESFCRTKTLSLTGMVLRPIADLFVVQWPYLAKYSNSIQYYENMNFKINGK